MGNLSGLSPDQKISYYSKVCESLGLNQLTKPFDYLVLNGKEVLYATKSCTEQLRNIHKVSLNITSRDKFDEVYVVTAKAKTPDGREDEATGAVNVANLKGDALANAYMKAETKAKRRVTLSICGLGMLDETEVETIQGAKFVNPELTAEPAKKLPPPPQAYRIPFQEHKNKTIKELYDALGVPGVNAYLDALNKKAVEMGKGEAAVQKLFEHCVAYEQTVNDDPFAADEPLQNFAGASELDKALDDPPAALAIDGEPNSARTKTVNHEPVKKKELKADSAVKTTPGTTPKKMATTEQIQDLMAACTNNKISLRNLPLPEGETMYNLSYEGLLQAKDWLHREVSAR